MAISNVLGPLVGIGEAHGHRRLQVWMTTSTKHTTRSRTLVQGTPNKIPYMIVSPHTVALSLMKTICMMKSHDRPLLLERSGTRLLPVLLGQRPGTQDGSLDEELRSFSPEMQRYVQMLQQRNRAPVPPAKPEKDLQDRLADMHLDDAELSSPPAGRNNPRPRPQHAPRRDMNAPRGTRVPPRFAESYRHNPTVEEYESDEDSARGSVVRNIDSQNVNSSTVVDSHNDNSTKTEISKSRSAR